MKIKKRIKLTIITAFAIIIILTSMQTAFAENDIRISYSGGSKLDTVAQINANKIDAMTLICGSNKSVKYEGNWASGYRTGNVSCVYLKVPAGEKIWQNTSWIYEGAEYDVQCSLLRTYNNTAQTGSFITSPTNGNIGGGYAIKASASATTILIPKVSLTTSGKGIFAEIHVDIFKHGTAERINIPRVYTGLCDIDAHQSYKCMNEPFTAANIFIKAKGVFYKNSRDTMFNSGSIYAQIINTTEDYDITSGENNAYIKSSKLYTEGLDLVFGFTQGSGSSIAFYTEAYNINYTAAANGAVSRANESVYAELKATLGSVPMPNSGYYFTHWTANQAVTTASGKAIASGGKITMAEIKDIVMTKNLTFTAHFAKVPQIKITKTSDANYYQKGEIVTYTLRGVNGTAGSVDNNVIIRDSLPDSLKLLSASSDMGEVTTDGNNVMVSIDKMTAADAVTVTITAEVLTNEPQKIDNTAAIEGDLSPNTDTNTASVNVVQPQLKITKSTDKLIYNVDDTIHYRIEVENAVADSHEDDIVITDKDLSEGVELDMDSIRTTKGEVVKGDNTFTVNVDTLKGSEKAIITFDGRIVNDKVLSKDLNNTATAKGKWTYEITDDSPITLTYNIITNAINGTITESRMQIPRGEDRTVAYQQYEGYYLKSLLLDGAALDVKEYPTLYQFNDIKKNYQIEAAYAKIPALTCTKQADKDVYSTLDTVTYTVTAQQTTDAAIASNIVICDKFDNAGYVEINKDSFRIMLNEEDITEECAIEVDSNKGYKIITGKNLNKTDVITVTYTGIAEKAIEKLTNTATAACDEAAESGNEEVNSNANASIKIISPKLKLVETVDKDEYVVGETGAGGKASAEAHVKVKQPNKIITVMTGDNMRFIIFGLIALLISSAAAIGKIISRKEKL